MSFGYQTANCGRCGVSFQVATGHVCVDSDEAPSSLQLDSMRQLLHDTRNMLAHQADQLHAAGSRERALVAALEQLWQFTAGLQLSDQPLPVQRERRAIAGAVIAVLMPQSAISDSMGDALDSMLKPRLRGGSGGGGGGGGSVIMRINGKVDVPVSNVSWKAR